MFLLGDRCRDGSASGTRRISGCVVAISAERAYCRCLGRTDQMLVSKGVNFFAIIDVGRWELPDELGSVFRVLRPPSGPVSRLEVVMETSLAEAGSIGCRSRAATAAGVEGGSTEKMSILGESGQSHWDVPFIDVPLSQLIRMVRETVMSVFAVFEARDLRRRRFLP
jgi:hypothetical protein